MEIDHFPYFLEERSHIAKGLKIIRFYEKNEKNIFFLKLRENEGDSDNDVDVLLVDFEEGDEISDADFVSEDLMTTVETERNLRKKP